MAGLRQLLNADEYLQEYDVFGFCSGEEDERSGRDERPAPSVSSLDALATTIETQIVPRLMLAHRAELSESALKPEDVLEPNGDDVLAFASIIIQDDIGKARNFVDELQGRGVSLESVFLELLAPTARHLGDLWLDDRCDFMSVTLGLSRLQQLLRSLSAAAGSDRRAVDPDKRALLITIPGEQHTFGMYMVAEFFRRGGWDVWGGEPEGDKAVLEFLNDDWFDVVGVSISRESSLARLDRFIWRMRKSSRNPQIAVLLGGRALAGRPDLAGEYGADAIADDGRQAVSQAEEMLGSSERRHS